MWVCAIELKRAYLTHFSGYTKILTISETETMLRLSVNNFEGYFISSIVMKKTEVLIMTILLAISIECCFSGQHFTGIILMETTQQPY